MDLSAYAADAEVEERHWWFVGRRRLFARELDRMGVAPDAPILDIGTSVGTNLRLLRDRGCTRATGLDVSEEAIRFCESKGLGPVVLGDAASLPFAADSFEVVLATDVLEHLPDDAGGAREVHRVLAPGGQAIVTVPAFQTLWGPHDERVHHFRRYDMLRLLAVLRGAGLEVQDAYYFNYLLFGPIWLARWLIRRLGIPVENETKLNAPLINRLLGWLFEADIRTAPLLHPPFGVSILARVRKAG